MKKITCCLVNEILLGLWITVLSVFAPLASYQGAFTDGDQADAELKGMKVLNGGNRGRFQVRSATS